MRTWLLLLALSACTKSGPEPDTELPDETDVPDDTDDTDPTVDTDDTDPTVDTDDTDPTVDTDDTDVPVDGDSDGSPADVDCDDADPAVHPGAAETCDGADQDCDGEADEDATDATPWYADADDDGYGDAASPQLACEAPAGHVSTSGDCADTDATAWPGAAESCDGADDDCDGSVDEDAVDPATWFADSDGDGFGDAAITALGCAAPAGHTADSTDCDDTSGAVHPGASETCNGVDDDCDGAVDPSSSADAGDWHADADGDGFGAAAVAATACDAPSGLIADGADCDDTDGDVHPGATESCNGADDDCDGAVDPDTSAGAAVWYADADSDGWGDGSSTRSACAMPGGYLAGSGDCDDAAPAVHPDATETCNGTDDDCDGTIDPSTSADALTWYADADLDGFGDAASTVVACDPGAAWVLDETDCDDAAAAVFPGAFETCDDVDEDCDGEIDEDAIDGTLWYPDADGDGHGTASGVTACDAPSGGTSVGDDCDDADPAVSPSATELCWNTTDEDCDGLTTGDRDCAPTGTATTPLATISGSGTTAVGTAIAFVGDVFGQDPTTLLAVPELDGLEEIAVGEGGANTVRVYGPLTETSSWTVSSDDYRISSTTVEQFGAAVASLDYDGDGDLELAVGAPSNVKGGTVYVFPMTGKTGSAYASSAASYSFDGMAASDNTGATLANAGDTDGDGLEDLLIGASGNDRGGSNAGAVWLVAGGAGSGTLDPDTATMFVGEAASDALSTAAGAGDVDGDGYDDVLLGSQTNSNTASGAGAVYLWRGPFHDDRYEVGGASLRIFGRDASDAVGKPLAGVGDLDADGHADIAVGASGWDDTTTTDAGAVGIFAGPLPQGYLDFDDADVLIAGESGTGRGIAAVAGGVDVDLDGWDDLLLTSTASSLGGSSSGAAFLFYGPVGSGHLSDADATFAGTASELRGTMAIMGGDVDDDGYPDFAVSSPGGADQVHVFTGGSREEATAPAPDLDADDDGDGVTENDGDCDDGRATRSPSLSEACGDGNDEDCDGYADRCAPAASTLDSAMDTLVANTGTAGPPDFGHRVRVVGDLNGDGTDDLGVIEKRASAGGPLAYVWFGPVPPQSLTQSSADVTFTSTLTVSNGAEVEAAGDLDADGYDDLILTYLDIPYVFRGGPHLTGTISTTAADWTFDDVAFAAGDLDGDGNDDLVAGGYDQQTCVFFGPVPTGPWTVADGDWCVETYYYGDTVFGMRAVGDVDGDGYDDLLVHNEGDYQYRSATLLYAGEYSIVHGPIPRSGTMHPDEAGLILPVYEGTEPMAASGDLDGDGSTNLVVRLKNTLAVIRATALAGVPDPYEAAAATVDISSLYDWSDVAVGDVDADGYEDLVVAGGAGSASGGGVWVFRGPMSGAYALTDADYKVTTATSWYTGWSVDVGDLDGDRFADIVFGMRDYGSGSSKSGAIAVLAGGWVTNSTVDHPAFDATVDGDGDGATPAEGDCDDANASIGPSAVEVCGNWFDDDCDGYAPPCSPEGDETNPSTAPYLYVKATSAYPGDDVNGDGVIDLYAVLSTDNAAYVLESPFGTGDVALSEMAATKYTTSDITAVYSPRVGRMSDADGDGLAELVAASSGASAVYVFGSTGFGTSGSASTLARWKFTGGSSSSRLGYSVADAGDVDADGIGDIAIAEPRRSGTTGQVVFFSGSLASGTHTTADATLLIQGASTDQDVGTFLETLGDLDGDGLDDLGFSEDISGYTSTERSWIWLNDGSTGTISVTDLPYAITRPSGPSYDGYLLGVGDLDGDGAQDVALRNPEWTGPTRSGIGYGVVWVWSGLPGSAEVAGTDADFAIDAAEYGGNIGSAVAPGVDIDGDGSDDLVVGTPVDPRLRYWYGPMTLSGTVAPADYDGGAGYPDQQFSNVVPNTTVAGDVDGDGFEDLWLRESNILWLGGPRD